jgi:UDP:flavonoid glycosyltransferase YjiC (YdhE family)
MRVLVTTRGSAGHLLPLAPFAHACRRAGHEVLVAAQRQNQAHVDRVGLPFTPVSDPPETEWVPLMARFAELDFASANELMIGEFFGGIDARAALPDLLKVVDTWKPDLLLRESWEFAATIAAELRGIPLARVGLGLASVEDMSLQTAAPVVDKIRVGMGLPADPSGDRLRVAPYFTMLPEALELATAPIAQVVRRFRTESVRTDSSLPDWWPGNDDPLVYLTFGSITAAPHLPYFPGTYQAAIDALASLPVRLLVTIGADRDPAELGPLPVNIRVEQWIRHDAVAPHADVVVCHGGYGSTFGTLAHGVPLVVLPIFSADQSANADAVARAGAGVAITSDLQTRGASDLPGPGTLAEIGPAVQRVLGDSSYRTGAVAIADAIAELPLVDDAVVALETIAGRPRS